MYVCQLHHSETVIYKHVVNLLHVSAFLGHYYSFVVEYLPEDSRKWLKKVGDLPRVCTLLFLWCSCLKIYGDLFYFHGTRIVLNYIRWV